MAARHQQSTCEWVDEAYSRRLWGQLVQRADRAARACGTLLTVRKYAWAVTQSRHSHRWSAILLVPGPGSMLDFVGVYYTRDGRRDDQRVMLRISEHAGHRLFERLRTNSSDDLIMTVVAAFLKALDSEFKNDELHLDWGTLYGVMDGGVWVAKTFIPNKAGSSQCE